MKWTGLVCGVLILALSAGCEKQQTVLRIFHAGSLSVPFRELEQIFEEENPGLDVQREAYGSAAAIRQVTELGRPADLVGSADYRLIDRLMIEAEPPHADWNLLFARNAMVLATAEPPAASEPDGWAAALADPEASVGMSNPNQDPCGYRGLFVIYLARVALGREGLFETLVLGNSNLSLEREGGKAVIEIPGAVRYTDRLTMRPKETDLVALLEAGAIDYLLIYRSVARQHGLSFLELPPEINLSDPSLLELYARVEVRQYADRPDRSRLIGASPIVYGLTIPRSVRQKAAARRFLELVLGERGREVMEDCGQAPLVPPVASPASDTGALPVAATAAPE